MAISTWITDISINNPEPEKVARLEERRAEIADDPNRRIIERETTRGIAACGEWGKPGDDHYRPAQDQSEPVKRYFEISYEGCVMETRERNFHDDSDFYAVVWDEASQSVKNVDYATTRGWTYLHGASVDITEENAAKARANIAERHFEMSKLMEQRRIEQPGPTDVSKGVSLVATVPISFTDKKRGTSATCKAGEIGKVIWHGAFGRFYGNGYNRPDRTNTRVGVRFPDGRVIFATLEKFMLDAEPTPDDVLRERAKRYAEQSYITPETYLGGLAVI